MKRNFKKILFLVFILLASIGSPAFADVSVTIRDGNQKIFEGQVPLRDAGTLEINDNTETPHSIDTQSVLSLMNDADTLSDNFFISNLEYFSSFGSLYLKCITGNTTGEKCDNWQYTVNDSYPGVGMDQKILSDGDSVYVYFGSQYRALLSSNEITSTDTLIVATEEYDYENNAWIARTGVTVGLTQPNPDDPWTPIEIQTLPVDANGQADFSNIPAGNYNVGVKEDFYFPTEALSVDEDLPISSSSTTSSSSGSKSKIVQKTEQKIEEDKIFDIKKALSFLTSQQKEDGSFGEEIYTDWITVALLSAKEKDQRIDPVVKLIKHFGESETSGAFLTDFERHAMSLMTLGLNPYNTGGKNYIKEITDSFDGKQFGDVNEDNDDIFALIVLQNAGWIKSDPMITSSLDFVLNRQKENGSWDDSVDMTGAGIQAIINIAEKSCFLSGSLSVPAGTAPPLGSTACETPQNKELVSAIKKAKEFLKQSQKDDGGWGNVSSTAWAMGGILALSENPKDWSKNGKTPLDYLAENQETDGGIKGEYLQNRIWETAYAVTALSDKTWNQIMQKFEKPKEYITTEEKEALDKKLEKILALFQEQKRENEILKQNIAKINNQKLAPLEKKTTTTIKEITEGNNSNQKIEDSTNQNKATALEAFESIEQEKIETPKTNWLKSFLYKIFLSF